MNKINLNKMLLISTAMLFKIFGALSLLAINYVISNAYSLDKVAEFGVLTSSLVLSSFVSKAGLDIYAIKHISKAPCPAKAEIAGVLIFISGFTSLLTAIVSYIVFHKLFFSVAVFLFGMFSVLPEILRANGDVIKYSAIRNFSVNFFLLLLIWSCTLIYSAIDITNLYLFSIVISLAICVFVYVYYSIPIKLSFPNHIKIRQVLSESLYMQISSFYIYLLGGFSVLILSFFKEKQDVAFFFICIQLALVFNMITTTIGMLYGPLLSKSYAINKSDFKYKYFQASLLNIIFLLPPLILYIVMGDAILSYFFGVEDREAYNVLIALSFGYFVSGVVGPKYAALNMTGHHKTLVKLMTIVVVIGLIMNTIVASLFSATIFAFSTIFFTISLSLGCFYIIVKRVF
ncbi:hypothetical protein PJK54_17045 [Cobetia sp. MMG027]|uniref:hypothetical protein n=1 Tax=Cobetia sp. MMG027 TaxID=3021980 RepID=UPI0022FECD95|nr:hypothetical protein [Cobetia sp. MMG027]MDA5565370.1 hypothetical protein [Cobetia sp. MMG027]